MNIEDMLDSMTQDELHDDNGLTDELLAPKESCIAKNTVSTNPEMRAFVHSMIDWLQGGNKVAPDLRELAKEDPITAQQLSALWAQMTTVLPTTH